MRRALGALLLSGLLAAALAGSGNDLWGVGTLVNYPAGKQRKTVPPQAGDVGDNSPIDVPCQCSDADPRDETSQTVGTTCFYHRVYGSCNADFLFDADAELAPEGFCQMSCGRCSCCSPPADVARQAGGTRFLQALEAAGLSLKELLSHPGLTATVLVPTDAAWEAFLTSLGPLAQNPGVLQQVIKFHILPPESRRNALWTSPFLALGPNKVSTLYDGPATLSTPRFALPAGTTWRGGLTGFSVVGPHNSAKVLKSDIPSCKGYITLIDTVLLPFDPAQAPANDALAAAAVVGAAGCAVQANSVVRGAAIRDGAANPQDSVGACCASCRASSGCNAWTFCAQRGGCAQAADAKAKVPFGWCALKSSPEVAAGREPQYEDVSAVMMPLVSGFLPSSGTVASAGRRLFRA